jgi:hypothetical protein
MIHVCVFVCVTRCVCVREKLITSLPDLEDPVESVTAALPCERLLPPIQVATVAQHVVSLTLGDGDVL